MMLQTRLRMTRVILFGGSLRGHVSTNFVRAGTRARARTRGNRAGHSRRGNRAGHSRRGSRVGHSRRGNRAGRSGRGSNKITTA
jgi:hypothetical protein